MLSFKGIVKDTTLNFAKILKYPNLIINFPIHHTSISKKITSLFHHPTASPHYFPLLLQLLLHATLFFFFFFNCYCIPLCIVPACCLICVSISIACRLSVFNCALSRLVRAPPPLHLPVALSRAAAAATASSSSPIPGKL